MSNLEVPITTIYHVLLLTLLDQRVFDVQQCVAPKFYILAEHDNIKAFQLVVHIYSPSTTVVLAQAILSIPVPPVSRTVQRSMMLLYFYLCLSFSS